MPGNEICKYSAYGFHHTQANTPSLGYSGQCQDSVTGYYGLGNGHRFYAPALMRFIQGDELSPFSKGGISAYAYCEGDPINRHDPTGRYLEWLRRGVARLNRWLSPETPPPSRRNSLPPQTMIEIEPQLPRALNLLGDAAIRTADHILAETTNDVVRAFTTARRTVRRQWNRLPEQVRSTIIIGGFFAVVPPAATTLMAAARTGSFLPLSPNEFYSMLIYGPTDTQRSALALRRNSF
ncbi:hypothetical protein CHR29_15550 [Pseudomonas monteilii]|uniref:RHS repeat-associated core domain-containing protein n=1 Tax=Pseudomonas TaxID=286 RepID=UPI0009B654C4|nr:hypothetical protein CHR29_15550 [Pseudomonas monteilii]AYN99843.1 hypothetical protein D8767_13080 [Pseudomonas sp. LTGT-11-2Z]MBA1316749.1 hypothetical protein [Pseudomonas monteilii]MBA6102803.1 hypothetical protein [Pseudomonas monteilii]MCT8189391.1 hypothetical protein [Pseudomonas monteilii]